MAGSSLREQQGRLRLRLQEPMEEVVYLDQVRLIAVDHPAGTEVYPNEMMAISAPPPPSLGSWRQAPGILGYQQDNCARR